MFALFVLGVLFVLVLLPWINMRNRFQELEARIDMLAAAVAAAPPVQPRPAPEPVRVPPPVVEPVQAPPRPAPAPPPPQAVIPPLVVPPPAPPILPPRPDEVPFTPSPSRTVADWETTLGGNWLNKLGAFIFVVGLALALGYSFTQMGPAGRVAISLTVGVAMLAAGAIMEPRDGYRIFARGLLAGGWAALYVTVYAMHAVPSARVIESPLLGAGLLMIAAAGMVLHSLRYRSQSLSGLAYFVAYMTLYLTQVSWLSVLALIPLAASMLLLAHRMAWRRLALFALAGTWILCALRGDSGAPLWQAQAVFTLFWLLFEGFDLLHRDPWLLPGNALGILSLSILKWHAAAPEQVWQLLAGTAGAYLISGVLRTRRNDWQWAITLSAALAAAAICLRAEGQWIAIGLLVEAEIVYLAGIRLQNGFLRRLAAGVFTLDLIRLLGQVGVTPSAEWTPVAAANAAFFYVNRWLCTADTFYGYGASALLALIVGYEVPQPLRGRIWGLLAAAAFCLGWWRRLWDFRLQAYLLAFLSVIGTACYAHHSTWGLVSGAALGAAAVGCALWSAPDRFREDERDVLRLAASVTTSGMLMALCWRLAPAEYVGLAWMALALPILECGLRTKATEFRWQAFAVGASGALVIVLTNLIAVGNTGPMEIRLIPLEAAVLAYAFAWRVRDQRVSIPGTVFLTYSLWALLPASCVAPAWGALAIALGLAGLPVEGHLLAALAAGRCWAIDFPSANRLATGSAVIACLYAAQFLNPRQSHRRLYYSILGTTLLSVLLWYQISGSLLTVAWGAEGAVLLVAGFSLRDRTLRLSGLTLMFGCILKLFLWDLRQLETGPRIASFLVLGLLLLGVSWIYTRFREHLLRYL